MEEKEKGKGKWSKKVEEEAGGSNEGIVNEGKGKGCSRQITQQED